MPVPYVFKSGPTCGRKLTPRETEVIDRLCKGWSNRRIAEDLVIGAWTTKQYVQSIAAKMGCRTRFEIVVKIKDREIASLKRQLQK